jgi:hypothetical protein
MPSLDKQSHHRFDWPGIVRTFLVEVLVLLALAGAFVSYLNWSSGVNVTEFMAEGKSPVVDPNHRPPSSLPVQTVKGRTSCDRKS